MYSGQEITLSDQAFKNADVNLDGVVNILDASLLQVKIASGEF